MLVLAVLASLLAVVECSSSRAMEKHTTTPKCNEFYIGAWNAYKAHHHDPGSYVGFSGDDALLVTKEDASIFTLIHEDLMTNRSHVGASTTVGIALLQKFPARPGNSSRWERLSSGAVEQSNDAFSLGHGKSVFCATNDGSVFAQYTKSATHECNEILMRAVDICDTPNNMLELRSEKLGSVNSSSTVPPSYPTSYPTSAPSSYRTFSTSSVQPASSSYSKSSSTSHPASKSKASASSTTTPATPSSASASSTASSTTPQPTSYPTSYPHSSPSHTTRPHSPTGTAPTCSDGADPSGGCTDDGPAATAGPELKFIRREYGSGAAEGKPRRRGYLVAPGAKVAPRAEQ